MLFGPVLVTAPDAVESLIVPSSRFPAANPPRMVLAPPVTLPDAAEFVIWPWLPLMNPPAVPPLPTVTFPTAKLFEIVLKRSLVPAKPPALETPVTFPNAMLPEMTPDT